MNLLDRSMDSCQAGCHSSDPLIRLQTSPEELDSIIRGFAEVSKDLRNPSRRSSRHCMCVVVGNKEGQGQDERALLT